MTNSEFQQWLKQFPDDAIIKVGIQQSPSGYQSYGAVWFEKFNTGEYDVDMFEFYRSCKGEAAEFWLGENK